jgi:hypothetical protein
MFISVQPVNSILQFRTPFVPTNGLLFWLRPFVCKIKGHYVIIFHRFSRLLSCTQTNGEQVLPNANTRRRFTWAGIVWF